VKYAIHTLDMWGHVSADCAGHGCPCMVTDEHGNDGHDENKCDCHEDCNQQFRRGTLTVPENTDDAALLAALVEEGFTFPPGTEVHDYSDGPLDINDADGRRLLHLIPEESEAVS